MCVRAQIFAVDLDAEMKGTELRSKEATAARPKIRLVQRALNIFVYSKLSMSERHQFGLLTLTDKANWLQKPCGREGITAAIARLNAEGEYRSFDMGSLFQQVESLVDSASVTRVVLIYGRSEVAPGPPVAATRGYEAFPLLNSPYFFLDCVYLHKPSSKSKTPQTVYDRLTSFDSRRRTGYFAEHAVKEEALFASMALLLAHPLQRRAQDAQFCVL